MRTVLILCLFLICFARQGHGNFSEFVKHIPGDVGRAISNTWDSIVEAIKRPVRNRRLGPAARKKALAGITTPKPYIWSSPPDTDKIIDDLEKKAADDRDDKNKLKLPLILLPQYSSLDIWMKRPYPTVSIRTTEKTESTTINTLKFYKETDADDGSLGHDESYIFRPMILL